MRNILQLFYFAVICILVSHLEPLDLKSPCSRKACHWTLRLAGMRGAFLGRGMYIDQAF